MIKNMGSADRIVRIAIALVIGWLWFTHRIHGTLGIVLCVVAVAFVVTSLIGWCPSYLPFKISTHKPSGGAPGAR
ncbi:MAG TPA: DUF2892 domain-containing protein [Candidatus Sulfotelmatobacter sp.]|nr:DUF2892 domain-containing protein [Candidatus Sulfotelmatobacter sp.]